MGLTLMELMISGVIGVIIGFVSNAYNNDNHFQLPNRNEKGFNPGFILDGIYGGLASCLMALLVTPANITGFIFLSVYSGYSGKKLLGELANRAESNKKDNAISRNEEKVNQRLDQIEFNQLDIDNKLVRLKEKEA